MEFKKEDMIDLNEQNVQKIFAYCLANQQTNPDNIVKANFFEKTENVNIPHMNFDKTRLFQFSNPISYLLGQLHSVHSGKSNMTATDGFKKYDGTNWTQNKVALFALYYLGTASASLPQFIYLDALKNYASPISDFKDILKPTLSPNDPNFKKKGGQEPADD